MFKKPTPNQLYLKYLQALVDKKMLPTYGEMFVTENTVSSPTRPKETYISFTFRADDEAAKQIKLLLERNHYVDKQEEV